ncbi:MAG: tRNA lysidine(34) synthetase TilS, partial [Planctomycetota bacterium]
IKEKNLFRPKSRLLLAVSGGADSTALLYVINSLKEQGTIECCIICAHIHHQLRSKEADKDEQFVISKCKELGVPIETRQIDVFGYAAEKKLSIETAARQLRISSLVNIAKDYECDCIATGHQMDDNAETILQRLGRGTGYRGLGGIWPQRKLESGFCFISPLLNIKRSEIIEYLTGRHLNWQTDKTNHDTSLRRNFIRHKLVPELQKGYQGDLPQNLSELSHHAQLFQTLLESNVDRIWSNIAQYNGGKIKLEVQGFLHQVKAVQIELVRRGLKNIGCGERHLTCEHYNRILHLASKNMSGKMLELPGSYVIKRNYQHLKFEQAQKKRKLKDAGQIQEIIIPGRTKFEDYLVEAQLFELHEKNIEKFIAEKNQYVEWFDFQELTFPLTIRFRREGDTFWPLGAPGQKRVGKFLTSAKVSCSIRERVVIISDSKTIIWVWPVRISEKHKVTKDTKKIIQLKIEHIPKIQ